jgi:adenylate cyclase
VQHPDPRRADGVSSPGMRSPSEADHSLRPISMSVEVLCASPPDKLWKLVSDTDFSNFLSGMPEIRTTPLSDGSAARFRVVTRSAGIPLEYDEAPYEWEEPRRYSVFRVVKTGPLRSIGVEVRLVPDGQGTRVTFAVVLTPRNLLGLVGAHVVGRVALWRRRRAFLQNDRMLLQAGTPLGALSPAGRLDGPLDRAARTLAGRITAAQRPIAERLIEVVRAGPDPLVGRLRPKALAQEWKVGADEVVPVFLHAVLAGVLDLSWELVCPSCRTGTEGFAELAQLPDQGHCQFCDLVFGVELDKAVEAVFRPQSAVRPISAGPWCIGGPARTPHVVLQRILDPGAKVELPVPQSPGRYRLFGRGGAVAQVEVDPAAGPLAQLVFEGERFEPKSVRVAPGGSLGIEHRAELQRHVKLEHVTWADLALSARELGFHPEFRRYFGRGTLREGQMLTVSRMCVLFSDLTGSTELYSRIGDAAAFQFVQDHFEYVSAIVQRRGGTVIKTIGDAVMAGFQDDADGLAAAIELQRGWAAFLATSPTAASCRLKVGLYGGPCYAVTANGQLDLFGQSVNVAARLQSEARSGEVIAPADLVESRRADSVAPLVVLERFVPELKGVADPPAVMRLGLVRSRNARVCS